MKDRVLQYYYKVIPFLFHFNASNGNFMFQSSVVHRVLRLVMKVYGDII